jgi:two-component system cell cycle sensor histidine kinase PleC
MPNRPEGENPPKPPGPSASDQDTKAALKAAEAALEAAIARERANTDAVRRRITEVVHDIKNPLAALLANTEILRKESLGPLGDARYKPMAEAIHDSGQRLLDYCQTLLDDFLRDAQHRRDESSPDAPQDVPRDVDAAAMVREIVALNQALAAERGIRLEAKIAPDFPPIHTLPTHLHRALTNLISNAMKFTPRGGRVMVDAYVDKNKNAVVMIVRDTGPGLTASDILRILSRDGGTRSAHGEKGAALGLVNVVRLVREAGGAVEIASDKKRGTAISIKFPLDLTRPVAA